MYMYSIYIYMYIYIYTNTLYCMYRYMCLSDPEMMGLCLKPEWYGKTMGMSGNVASLEPHPSNPTSY